MSQVLVIDDEHVIRELMCEILDRAGYDAVGADTAERALAILDEQDVALVVSDIVMPKLSGLELLEEVRARRPSLPVVLVTGAGTYENLSEAVTRGADGLVIKPFSHAELQNAVSSALERARRSEHDLRERVLAPTLAAILANAIEARDAPLQGHCERLGELAVRLASLIGLPETGVERVRLGAVLHDIGKIGIPDRVLLKKGPFDEDERALMRQHPLIGDRLLAPLDILGGVRAIVRHHHEQWDGSGYPDGLAGKAIPLEARIVTIADAVEAMSAPRPYRDPLTFDDILRELEQGRGTQWDPALVDRVLALIDTGELQFEAEGLRLLEPRQSVANSPASILLVDPDPDQALAAAASMEDSLPNVQVVHARDARSATDLCRSSRWALAVLDNNLPDGSGLDLLRTIKDREPALPVVVLTAEGSETVAIEAFRRGASDYVVKSNGYLTELEERIRPLLEASWLEAGTR